MSEYLEAVKPISPEHFDDLQKMAQDHWWYMCRMDWVVTESLKIYKANKKVHFIDIGAGVGSVSENFKKYIGLDVTSVENDPYACAVIRSKGLRLIAHNIERRENLPIELSKGENVFFFLDVLEHLAHPRDVLTSLAQNPNDLYCIVTVPAFNFLYSYWDRELGHFVRYQKSSFKSLVEGTGWKIQSMSYFFSFAVLPAFVFRKVLARFNPQKRLIIPKSSRFTNRILYTLYRIEKFLNLIKLGPPLGTSLMVVLKKEAKIETV